MGFFAETENRGKRPYDPMVARCTECGLWKGCQSPKMTPRGHGEKRVMIIGDAPGHEEDARGAHMAGPGGQRLRAELSRFGVDLDDDCWTTTAITCRPTKVGTQLKDEQIAFCRANYLAAVEQYKPDVIIPLGNAALKAVVWGQWTDDEEEGVGDMGQWGGWRIPLRQPNAWVCPTFHPLDVSRNEERNPAQGLWFGRHLKAAFELVGKPWPLEEGPPDYTKFIYRVHNDTQAADILAQIRHGGAPIAFDYETNMLKPDGPDAEIVCCSVCVGGGRTLAYPWTPITAAATSEILKSPVPKVASNMKFEERWTRRILGHGVRNWVFDTMQAAHVLKQASGVTSIKFQAFVRTGWPRYDAHISPLLHSAARDGVDESRCPNRVREIPMRDLLLYCGLDSFLEYRVAQLQCAEIGMDVGLGEAV